MKAITTLTSTILLSLLATSATAQERGGAHQREGAKPAAQHGKKTDAQRGHSDKPATRDKVQEQGRGTGHDAQGKGHDKARDAGNYANISPLMDLLFGTYRCPKHEPEAFGQ